MSEHKTIIKLDQDLSEIIENFLEQMRPVLDRVKKHSIMAADI